MPSPWAVNMSETFESLFKDFEDAIRNYCKSDKVIKGFDELRKRQDQSFNRVLDSIFVQLVLMFDKNKDCKKGIKLILKVLDGVVEKEDDVEGFERFLVFVIEGGNVKDGDFRRACAWTIRKSLPLIEKYVISKKTYEKLLKIIELLTIDKNHKIRKLACEISKNLDMQNQLLSSLSWEHHKKVTKYLIKSIQVNKKSSKSISKRLKDNDPDIRISALKALTKNNEFYCLDRIIPLIYDERDEKVKALVIKTIENYLNQFSLIDLPTIFNSMKQKFYQQNSIMRSFEYICKELVNIDQLFNTISLILPKIQDLNIYELLVFRYSCSSLHIKDEYKLHSILSSPNQLKISENILQTSPAYIQNILKTFKYLDIGDEIIRNEVLNELRTLLMKIKLNFNTDKENILIENFLNKMNNQNFLATCQEDVLVEIVKTFKYIIKDNDEFLRLLLETINEIIDPLFNKLNESLWTKKEKLEKNIERLENDLKTIQNDGKISEDVEVVNESNRINLRIQECENNLEESNERIYDLLVKACVLLCEVIKCTSFYLLPQHVYEVCKVIVQAGLKFEDTYVQANALNCLGALCLKFPNQCLEFFNIFDSILKSKSIGNKEMIALVISIDFSIVYEKPHLLLPSIIESIHSYSQSTNNYFRSIALEGLCKLFTIGRINQPDILSDLLLAYFMSDLKPQTKQILFTFFSNYSNVSQSSPKILADAYFFTLMNLSKQGLIFNQALSFITKMNYFILSLLDPELLANKSFENFQFYLFSVLASEIYENKSGFFILKLLLSVKFHLFSSEQATYASKIINDIRVLNLSKACMGTCDKIVQAIQTSIVTEQNAYPTHLELTIKQNYTSLRSNLLAYLAKRNLSTSIPPEFDKENLSSTKSIQSPLSQPIKKAKLSEPN